MEGIDIPLRRGTIDEMVPSTTAKILESESSGDSQESGDSSQLREEDAEIDFSKLKETISNLEDDDFEKYLEELLEKQDSIQSQMEEIRPDFKVLL